MGVRRLQTFLEKHCPAACYRVMLAPLANEFRDLHGKDPVIVMDGSSCFRQLYMKFDWICGGQAKEFASFLKLFFLKFKELGIKIVVIFDATLHDKRRNVWVDRRYEDMKKAHAVIDELKEGSTVESINQENFLVPCGILHVIESACQAYAEDVFRCLSNHTKEIATYAEKNNCLAILGQNSDFIMYNLTISKYFSIEKLDLTTMSSLIYDQVELARSLNLELCELPILATLMGNDTFQYYELRRFHSKVVGGVINKEEFIPTLVKKLVEFLQRLPKGDDLILHLGHVSKYMFNTSTRSQELLTSIESYNLSKPINIAKEEHPSDHWCTILEIAHEDCIKMHSTAQLYLLLRYHKFEFSTGLQDYRGEVPVSVNVLAPLRKRLYGVALKEYAESTGKAVIVEEYCMTGAKSLDKPVKVEALIPSDDFPGLLKLWGNDSTTVTTKLNVLTWMCARPLYNLCISGELNEVPTEILGPVCLLSFLYKEASVLDDFEVKVFAAVAVDVQAMDHNELSTLKISSVDVHGIQLSTLYTHALKILICANDLAGSPIPKEWLTYEAVFDGKLFHTKFMAGESPDQLVKKGSKENFDLLCRLILE